MTYEQHPAQPPAPGSPPGGPPAGPAPGGGTGQWPGAPASGPGVPPYPAAPASPLPAGYHSLPTPTTALPTWAVAVARPRRRVPTWMILVGAATAVLSVVAFVTVVMWPAAGDDPREPAPPLRFTGLQFLATIAYDQPSNTTLAAIRDQRAYVGWEQENELRIAWHDLATGQEQRLPPVAGQSPWVAMFATGATLLAAEQERVYLLDAATGEVLLERPFSDDHRGVLGERRMVLLDPDTRELLGFDLTDGGERWREPLPADGEVRLLRVLTLEDLARPTDINGNTAPGGGARVVLVSADGTAQTFDTESGAVVTAGANVAEPGDRLLAYRDRLYVASDAAGYELRSYPLDQLDDQPVIHYRAAEDAAPTSIAPCGGASADRVCLLEAAGFSAARIQLVSVQVAGGAGEVWREDVPEARRLLPVGDWVLAVREVDFSTTVVSPFDRDGRQAMEDLPGKPARLNDGNFAVVTSDGGFGDPVNAVGVPIAVGAPTAIGPLPDDATVEQCAWNQRLLVCPARAEATVHSFARDG